ncbi:unnamed protein product [Cercopithifilaria johnstoni]|uniref:Uncharacterized protein n=1 Tax=Cercopithifilaria johnstoni TaxID=2874296 RepID=A0A8J2PUF1_9BILA|nr:unnamed protein product [Cercopithifilaria johnstoni]
MNDNCIDKGEIADNDADKAIKFCDYNDNEDDVIINQVDPLIRPDRFGSDPVGLELFYRNGTTASAANDTESEDDCLQGKKRKKGAGTEYKVLKKTVREMVEVGGALKYYGVCVSRCVFITAIAVGRMSRASLPKLAVIVLFTFQQLQERL